MITAQEYAQQMIAKYNRYIANLKWHIETNNPNDAETKIINQRIADMQGFISDLSVLA